MSSESFYLSTFLRIIIEGKFCVEVGHSSVNLCEPFPLTYTIRREDIDDNLRKIVNFTDTNFSGFYS